MFIPSVDRHHAPIDQLQWRDEALKTLGLLFRQTGELVFDDTVMVTTYVPESAFAGPAVAELRAFLHRMGRDANQGENGVVIDDSYYGITDYDPEARDG